MPVTVDVYSEAKAHSHYGRDIVGSEMARATTTAVRRSFLASEYSEDTMCIKEIGRLM